MTLPTPTTYPGVLAVFDLLLSLLPCRLERLRVLHKTIRDGGGGLGSVKHDGSHVLSDASTQSSMTSTPVQAVATAVLA